VDSTIGTEKSSVLCVDAPCPITSIVPAIFPVCPASNVIVAVIISVTGVVEPSAIESCENENEPVPSDNAEALQLRVPATPVFVKSKVISKLPASSSTCVGIVAVAGSISSKETATTKLRLKITAKNAKNLK